MRLKFKKGGIPSARLICVDLLGPSDGDDFDGNGYGSVDIAEILSGAYYAQEKRIAELEIVAENYQELLYCVANKFPDETRHETAKRYIMEREKPYHQASAAGYLGGGE